jgi:hypothetical protein
VELEEFDVGLSFLIVFFVVFFFIEGGQLLFDCLQAVQDPEWGGVYFSRYYVFSSVLSRTGTGFSLSMSVRMRFYSAWIVVDELVGFFFVIR